jgi:AraC-like DNA-binding protein
VPAASSGSLTLDLVDARLPFHNYQYEWETRIGGPFSLPSLEGVANSRMRTRTTRLQDILFGTYQGTAGLRTAPGTASARDHVRLWLTYQGGWRLGDAHGEHTLKPSTFTVHRGPIAHFEAEPHTRAWVLVLPSAVLEPLIGRRRITVGSSSAAEVRLLVAHATTIQENLENLRPSGIQAASDTLAELSRAVVRGEFDDHEPLLAPALARAAKDYAEQRLGDPGLSPKALAEALGVSLRTLQRAFAADGESMATWIRDRRLHHALQALILSGRPPSITEVAARWQFADSSHFVRAFRRHYGCSPTQYMRMHRLTQQRSVLPQTTVRPTA